MPLVFVPTPLGNLRDITLRAIDVLRDCTLVVAEDTRVARKLLTALALPGKEIFSYREQNARGATGPILARARESLVAVVTDAGMPGISDPGVELVAAARTSGIDVEVLPGPNAALGAAVLSGFPLGRFIFEGFPPRTSSARRASLKRALEFGIASIWYESSNRIRGTLRDLSAVDPAARVFLLREYTKRFEQQLSGTAAEVGARLAEPVRGEITIVVMPSAPPAARPLSQRDLDKRIDALLATSHSVAAVAKALSAQGLGERRDIYARAGKRKRTRRE
jgi:16S rRNA (cytidine1402-2'-O)-methyltransferase